MRRAGSVVLAGFVVLTGCAGLAVLSGCEGDDGGDATSSGGAAATGGTGTGTGASASTGGAGGVPSEPFTITNGICRPSVIEGSAPIYEIDSVFGHVGAMATRGDTLYFAESADFDDIPPRIAMLTGDAAPTTVVDAVHASALEVLGDTLYYVDNDTNELKSVDLATPGAAPVVRNTVEGIWAYDEQHVVYADATSIFSVGVGAADLSGAVTLRAAEGIYFASVSGETVLLASREGVYRVGVDGSGAADVVPDDSFAFIRAFASDATSVYYDQMGTLTVAPIAGGVAPLGIGVAGPSFSGTAEFTELVPASGVVYWADDEGYYGFTATDGTRCGILGTHDGFFAGGGALSDSYFFASGEATVYRVARVD